MFELDAKDLETVTTIRKNREGGHRGMRADALRLKHKGYSHAEVAEFLEVTPRTVSNIIGYYKNGGIESALNDDPRPGRPTVFDDRDKCRLIAMVCSNPPEGFDRWSLDLIVEEAIERKITPSISREQVRIILHEHDLKPWQQKMWCIPDLDEEYVERMESVLNLYEDSADSEIPLVCLDEKSIQLTEDSRASIEAKSGTVKKVDSEYRRKGTANLFFAFEPLKGVYWTEITHTRKSEDFAVFLADIAAQYHEYPKVNLVMDNLNTHFEKSLIDKFGKEKGKAVWNHFNVHYTPKHGSWLNQAEIGLGMYSRQCLDKTRVSDINTLKKKTNSWTNYINEKAPTVEWDFKVEDAREKFNYGKY